MSRARKKTYLSSEVSELTRQMLYAPPDKRAQVVRLTERFHDELDAAKNYPIDYVVYRLTDRRVPPRESVMLVGQALGPDLRLLIDDLSQSIQMPVDADDPAETTGELARRLGVSTKTIGRWRDKGLRWRWAIRQAGDKPRVLFTRSAVDAFHRNHPQRLESAGQFSRMSDQEKGGLIQRAMRLYAAVDTSPQAVINHLSKRTGRSREALRLLFADHDRASPAEPVFPDRTGPLSSDHKLAINQAYQQGACVSAICLQFQKTRSTIYRVIHEAKAAQAISLPIEAIASPTFDRDDADEVLLRPIKREADARRLDRDAIEKLPEQLQPFYNRAIDSEETFRVLAVRYNYLKHRARLLQAALREAPPTATTLKQFDALMQRIKQARAEAIAGQLPLVLSVVRRQLGKDHSHGVLLQGLDIGNRVLIEEADRFDVARSHTFESVLTNRMLRVLATLNEQPAVITAQEVVARLEDVGLNDHSPPA